MSDGSHIQWCDATWNIVTGCTRVSPGCDRCYIVRTPPFRMGARRFDGEGAGSTTGVTLHHDRLDQPLRWRKPRRVFTPSLGDLFHPDVPDGFIGSVWDVMAQTPQHTYQVLTKRPARMRSLLRRWGQHSQEATWRRHDMLWCGPAPWPLPNVWLGVSVEDQERADQRIPVLLDTPAAVRFVSAEPLLGPVDLRGALGFEYDDQETGERVPVPPVAWVIVGGESGPGARPMHLDWARSLVEQCRDSGSACFVKQLGSKPIARGLDIDGQYRTVEVDLPWTVTGKGGDMAEWPADLRVREFPQTEVLL